MLSAKMVVLKIGKPEKGFETLSKFMAMSNMSNALRIIVYFLRLRIYSVFFRQRGLIGILRHFLFVFDYVCFLFWFTIPIKGII